MSNFVLRTRWLPASAFSIAFAFGVADVSALTITHRDCHEGADFIGNAARSRDNGMTAHAFLERLEGDLQLIKAFPPDSRWFAKDDEDADLLRQGVKRVFSERSSPDKHRAGFLKICNLAAERVLDE